MIDLPILFFANITLQMKQFGLQEWHGPGQKCNKKWMKLLHPPISLRYLNTPTCGNLVVSFASVLLLFAFFVNSTNLTVLYNIWDLLIEGYKKKPAWNKANSNARAFTLEPLHFPWLLDFDYSVKMKQLKFWQQVYRMASRNSTYYPHPYHPETPSLGLPPSPRPPTHSTPVSPTPSPPTPDHS